MENRIGLMNISPNEKFVLQSTNTVEHEQGLAGFLQVFIQEMSLIDLPLHETRLT